MSLTDLYQERVLRFTQEEERCSRQNNRYAWIRLLIITMMLTLGIWFYTFSPWLSIITVLILMAVFFLCLKKHLKNIELQHHYERLKQINDFEKRTLEGDFTAYDPGEQYIDPKHYYTSDLDIFGTHSLFRYLNRTTSPSGSNMLAQWLTGPASTPDVKKRQEAVSELASLIDWRQQIQSIGLKYTSTSKELPGFLKWLEQEPELLSNRKLLLVMRVLPWITTAVIIAAVIGWVPSGIIWLLVAVHFVISGMTMRKVNLLHQQISRKVDFISSYFDLIQLFVKADFSSFYLKELRSCFTYSHAPEQIKALKARIKKLDYRLNMFYIPVNILFFFDYKHLIWLEKWRMNNHLYVQKWFEAIAEVEALSSFANLKFNNPDWVMPNIREQYFVLEAQNIGHPLILEKERVCNDFNLDGQGHIGIITGSNMSGKSTFQRSIGVNMVLALAGSCVCAEQFTISNCKLYTYMRIADNLEERTSSFYAELKRLKRLIEITREEQIFFLLDEILRGTNSRDRQIGSMALIRQLARQQVSGIIATHDLALGTLKDDMPEQLDNYHFDVQINGEDMSFDYKIHTGICTSLNASILMKKIGIEVNS